MTVQRTTDTESIDKMVEKLGIESIFGKPTSQGDVTIIPVAEVNLGFGYGGTYGLGSNGTKPDVAKESGSAVHGEGSGGGGSGGGGAGGRVIPRGYLRITPDGVSYEPIIDVTRIPLAGIILVAWSIFWITVTIRAVTKNIVRRKRVV